MLKILNISDPTTNRNMVENVVDETEVVDPPANHTQIHQERGVTVPPTLQCRSHHKRRQRTRMNKHKLRKWRKRHRAPILEVRKIREWKRGIRRTAAKKKLVEKCERLRWKNPRAHAEYTERTYVKYRLLNW